jgi:hypothetical protein
VFILALVLFVSFGTPTRLANLKNPSVNESSGLVASRSMPGVYWTHNDSGDGPFIYAFDAAGESRGVFRVSGAQARDWEDMSIGPGPRRGQSLHRRHRRQQRSTSGNRRVSHRRT